MKTERISASLGIKFVYCDGRYITETGVLFTKEEANSLSEDEIRALYKDRLTGRLYDYEYAKTTGFVRKRKELVFTPSEEIEIEEEESFLSSLRDKAKKTTLTPVRVIKIIVTIVAIGAVVMSALYSGEYQGHRVGKALGYFQATIMVLFATAAFEAGILFLKRKEIRAALVGVLFFFLWLVPSVYNMYTVMNITFESYKEISDVKDGEVNARNAAREALSDINKKISDAEGDVTRLRGIADAYLQRETYSVWTARENSTAVATAQAKVDSLRDSKKDFLASHPDAVNEAVEEVETFSSLVHRLFGIQQDALQLIVDTFPAIFFDIVAPFGFAIVILLKDEEEEINGREEGK